MFIRPNEFEAQLAAAKTAIPVYKRSHRAAGVVFLLVLAPVIIFWLAVVACWTTGAALVRAPFRFARLLRDAAGFGGWLVLR